MLSTREYSCLECGKRMLSTSGLTRHMNAYTSQIIQQGLSIRMQSKQNMPIPREDDNSSEYFGLYKNKEYTLEK